MKLIQIAAATLVASAYATMVLGAYVKAIGAGMACAEWPHCNNGELLPALDSSGVTAEMFHRIAATTVILAGVSLLTLELWLYRGEKRLLLLTLLAGGVLGVQVALGAITISSNLQPLVVTSHLAVATLFFALSLFIALKVWKLPPAVAPSPETSPEAPKAPDGDPKGA